MQYGQLYKNRNFMKLILGNTISGFGDSMYNIALTISLYQTTGNVSAVAYMWLIRASMRIPIQFIAGIIADSFPGKRIITLTNSLSALRNKSETTCASFSKTPHPHAPGIKY